MQKGSSNDPLLKLIPPVGPAENLILHLLPTGLLPISELVLVGLIKDLDGPRCVDLSLGAGEPSTELLSNQLFCKSNGFARKGAHGLTLS